MAYVIDDTTFCYSLCLCQTTATSTDDSSQLFTSVEEVVFYEQKTIEPETLLSYDPILKNSHQEFPVFINNFKTNYSKKVLFHRKNSFSKSGWINSLAKKRKGRL